MKFNRSNSRARRAFTLVEVLLAVMILGIGMIMIAAVYPVGATWTRQNIEETVAAAIAKNAVGIIRSKYVAADFASLPSVNNMYPLPGVSSTGKLPLIERAYGLGLEPPYPISTANNPLALQQATYFWTALVRRPIVTQNNFDIYILVFRKGSSTQTFSYANALTEQTNPTSTRDPNGENFVPYVGSISIIAQSPFPSKFFKISGVSAGVTPALKQSLVGSQIIEVSNGSVLRVIAYDPGADQFTVNGKLESSAFFPIFFAPPADGEAVSPLVYVYQTTVAF